MDEASISLLDLLAVFQRRWRLILAITLAVGIGAGLVAFLVLHNQYTAVGLLEVAKSRSGSRTNRDDITALPLDTFIYYVTERGLVHDVLQRFKLDQPPLEYSLDDFLERIQVRQIRNTNLIEVSVTLHEPKLARDVAEKLCRQAITLNGALLQQEIERSAGLQRMEFERIVSQVREVRDRWQQTSIEADAQALKEELMSLGGLLREVETERAVASAMFHDRAQRVKVLQPLFEGPDAIGPVFAATRSISEYQDLQDLMEGVLEDVAPGARPFDLLPVYVTTEERNRLYDELMVKLKTWQAERDGYKAQVNVLDASAADVLQRMNTVENRLVSGVVLIDALEEEFRKLAEIMKMQAQHVMEATARVVSERQDIRLLGPPQLPEKKSGPRRTLIVFGAMLVALVGVTLVCMVLELAALAAVSRQQQNAPSR
jgi:uncharacterized protein involved in exopolysaccharide biosynthesis